MNPKDRVWLLLSVSGIVVLGLGFPFPFLWKVQVLPLVSIEPYMPIAMILLGWFIHRRGVSEDE